jgi:ABC-type microcin C transport system duplicated ATPase subunit YejF
MFSILGSPLQKVGKRVYEGHHHHKWVPKRQSEIEIVEELNKIVIKEKGDRFLEYGEEHN